MIATDEEFQRLYLLADAPMKTLLLLCRTLALRHAEAEKIRPCDLNMDTNTLTFKRKDSGGSYIPLTPELSALFRHAAAIDPNAPLLETIRGKKQTRRTTYNHWLALRKRAHANPHLTFHDLRRTDAVKVFERTKDPRIVQRLLGHHSLPATWSYLSPFYQTAELRQAVLDAAPSNLDALPLATDTKQ